MRNLSFKSIAVVGLAFATLSSCNSMKDLDKNYYSVNPNPLEVHGGKIKVDVKGQFPEKLFKKNVAVELTPVLRYEGGNTAYKMMELQGEEYPGNATVIPYETGKSVSYEDEIEYTPEMKNSQLYVNVVGKKGDDDRKEFEPILVAPGVITTSLLAEDDFKSSAIAPAYTQTTKHEANGMVNFLVNSPVVRSKELKDEDFKKLADLVKSAGAEEKVTLTDVAFVGWASPEGEATLNSELSDKRAINVMKKIEALVKKAKIEFQDDLFSTEGKGADWDGVYELIKASDIEDKDMLLRSLDDQPLLDSKEATLKSLANTYDALKDDILPELRRTEVVISYDLVGKTDEEIMALAAMSVEELKEAMVKPDGTEALQIDAEELLYAASKVETKEERLAIMKKAMELYPYDYRFATNAGHCEYALGNKEAAAELFEKAYNVEENDVTTNNLAVAKALTGEMEAANELFAKSTTPEASYNRGVKAMKEGDYAKAIEDMQGMNTFNLALAKVLNGDYDGALKTLEAGEMATCKADYLRAIASQRLGKTEDAKAFIASAIEKNPKMEEMAKSDLEFRDIYAPAAE